MSRSARRGGVLQRPTEWEACKNAAFERYAQHKMGLPRELVLYLRATDELHAWVIEHRLAAKRGRGPRVVQVLYETLRARARAQMEADLHGETKSRHAAAHAARPRHAQTRAVV